MSPEYKDGLALVFIIKDCLLRNLASLTENVIDTFILLAFGNQITTNSLQSYHIDEPVSLHSKEYAGFVSEKDSRCPLIHLVAPI